MQKLSIWFIAILVSFALIIVSQFANIKPVHATSNLVASCQSGLNTWWRLTDDVKQEVEIRDDNLVLDSVAGYMMSSNHNNDTVYVQFIRRDQGIVSEGSGTVSATPSWVYISMSPVQIPRGVYYLKIYSNTQGGAIWSYSHDTSCYEDGMMLVNGVSQSADMDFAVYAHTDTGSSGSSSSSSSPSSSSSTSSRSSTPSKSSTSSSNLKSTWTQPTDAEILAMTRDSDSGGVWGDLFTTGLLSISGLLMFLLPILFFGTIIVVIIVIIVLRKKKAPPVSKEKTK